MKALQHEVSVPYSNDITGAEGPLNFSVTLDLLQLQAQLPFWKTEQFPASSQLWHAQSSCFEVMLEVIADASPSVLQTIHTTVWPNGMTAGRCQMEYFGMGTRPYCTQELKTKITEDANSFLPQTVKGASEWSEKMSGSQSILKCITYGHTWNTPF